MTLEALTLSSFAYILEASFGLNLAFGLIEQIHDGGARSYASKKRGFFADLKTQVTGIFSEGRTITETELEETAKEWDKQEQAIVAKSKKKVAIAIGWAYFATVISLVLLALIGFKPNLLIHEWIAFLSIIGLVVPTPTMYFYLKYYWKTAFNKLKNEFDLETRVYEKVKKAKMHINP